VSGVVGDGGKERGGRESGESAVPAGGRPEAAATDSAAFVEQWLGPLIGYDTRGGTELTATLSEFLEHHGDLTAAAAALEIHRSTLRYRLFRIRELTGFDIGHPGTCSSLLRAARVWRAG
jgi:DNA-binding PucR family transcriptional regulator